MNPNFGNRYMRGLSTMDKEELIKKINEIIKDLTQNELIFITEFLKKIFTP